MKTPTLLVTNFFSLILAFSASHAVAAERFSTGDWQKSFHTALQKNDTAKALQLIDFKTLEATAIPACVDCESKKNMAKARELFAQGKYTAALELYNAIPKTSDLWLQAVEERGWAQFRQDNFEKSIAQAKTLLSPQFSGITDTEAYLLQSLSQLRICDYAGVLETDRKYKESQRTRLVEMQALASSGMNANVQKAIDKVEQFPLQYADFGDTLPHLPMLFYRDTEMQKQLLRHKVAQAALASLADGQMLSLRSQLVGVQEESFGKIKARMQVLAQQDLDKAAIVLQKINLVEIETIQRVHADLEAKDLYKKNQFQAVNSDQLVFKDDGRPWIDELDKYEVAAKVCSKGIRRKM